MPHFPYMAIVVDYTGYIALDNYFLRHYTHFAVQVGQLDCPIDLVLDWYTAQDCHTYFVEMGVVEVHKLRIAQGLRFRSAFPIVVFSAVHKDQLVSFPRLVEQNSWVEADPMSFFVECEVV